MTAQIIDGEALARKITEQVTADVISLKRAGRPPVLHAVQANDNPGSRMYVKMQKQTCESVGIEYVLDELPVDSSEEALVAHIQKLNADRKVTGIILQMPVPEGVNARRLQAMIAPHKDAEGMSPANMGRLIYGKAEPGPCTAVGAVELLKSTGVKIEGKDAVVVGHSEIVGKPIVNLLLGLNATVSCCHIFTRDLESYVRRAEILFVAAGKSQAVWTRYQREVKKNPNLPPPDLSPLIPATWVREGAVVIDVAINRIPVGFDKQGKPLLDAKGKPKMKTVGDVDFEGAKERAAFITPVPGGVGPMTVAMLLKNTVDCARMQLEMGVSSSPTGMGIIGEKKPPKGRIKRLEICFNDERPPYDEARVVKDLQEYFVLDQFLTPDAQVSTWYGAVRGSPEAFVGCRAVTLGVDMARLSYWSFAVAGVSGVIIAEEA